MLEQHPHYHRKKTRKSLALLISMDGSVHHVSSRAICRCDKGNAALPASPQNLIARNELHEHRCGNGALACFGNIACQSPRKAQSASFRQGSGAEEWPTLNYGRGLACRFAKQHPHTLGTVRSSVLCRRPPRDLIFNDWSANNGRKRQRRQGLHDLSV